MGKSTRRAYVLLGMHDIRQWVVSHLNVRLCADCNPIATHCDRIPALCFIRTVGTVNELSSSERSPWGSRRLSTQARLAARRSFDASSSSSKTSRLLQRYRFGRHRRRAASSNAVLRLNWRARSNLYQVPLFTLRSTPTACADRCFGRGNRRLRQRNRATSGMGSRASQRHARAHGADPYWPSAVDDHSKRPTASMPPERGPTCIEVGTQRRLLGSDAVCTHN